MCMLSHVYGRNPLLRVNPGGGLDPVEVVGRDEFVDAMWSRLEHQSILLTAERRMGKTSVLVKMVDEAAPNIRAIKTSLQGVTRPEEFVGHLIADTESTFPGILKRSLGDRVRAAGVRNVGISPLSIEFEPTGEKSWKALADDIMAAIEGAAGASSVVFLWDELPHMVANVRDNCSPRVAREMLDLLRSWRETHRHIRMVFSGSLGLHHVIEGLRSNGGMWVPTHDMLVIDVPPLLHKDATYLAGELLRNEEVECDDVDEVAATIAAEVDNAPYYVHHTVHNLIDAGRAGRSTQVNSTLVRQVVDEAIHDPLDPWQLQHYIDRVGVYYGTDGNVVKAVLDVVARATEAPTLETIHSQIGALVATPALEHLRDLLTLLNKDHYLGAGPAYSFRLDLVRRAWLARRP